MQVADEVHAEAVGLGLTLKNPVALGILGTAQGKEHTFRLQTNLWFPQVCHINNTLYVAAHLCSCKPHLYIRGAFCLATNVRLQFLLASACLFTHTVYLCKQPLSEVTVCSGRGLTNLLMQAKLAKFTAAARTQLRSCLAGFVSLPTSSVTIEGIKSGQCSSQPSSAVQPTKTDNADDNRSKSSKHITQEAAEASGSCLTTNGAAAGVTVAVHIQLGSAEQEGKQLVAALQAAPETVVRDDTLLAAVGMPGRPSLPAAIINLTPVPSNMLIDEPRKSERVQAAVIPSAQLVQVGLDWHAHSANPNLQ